MAADLGTTLDTLLSCVCDALVDAGRPACRCGQTVGAPILGQAACCECDQSPGGQLSVTLQRMYPVDPSSFAQIAVEANCRPSAVAADVAFTLARCHPTINNLGDPPSLDDVASFADGASDDVQIMWNALSCGCAAGFRLVVRDAAIDSDPQGGCSAVGMRVTVLVTPTTPQIGS